MPECVRVGDATLHLGDCRGVLPMLPDGSIDAVVTDPPYGMKAKLDSMRFSGGKAKTARRPGDGRDDWPAVIGDDRSFDPSPWIRFPKVILWGANHYAERLPRGVTLVWIKKADKHFGSFLSDAEIAWQKGGHGVYCYRQTFQPPSRMYEGGGKVLHPMQKPVGLMEWCLRRLRLRPGAVVFDPFMGSGTVGVAAGKLGLKYVGCEIVPSYFEAARQRLSAVHTDGPLFVQAGVTAEE